VTVITSLRSVLDSFTTVCNNKGSYRRHQPSLWIITITIVTIVNVASGANALMLHVAINVYVVYILRA